MKELVGLTAKEARDILKEKGLSLRIVEKDGKKFGKMDAPKNRIDVIVKNDIILNVR